MFSGKRSVLWLAAVVGVLSAAPSFAQPDLTYHAVTPCVLVDTRTTGGAFSPSETRTYNVAGSCGVPAWSNNIAQAQAVALTITAISPGASGNLRAYAADVSSTLSVINFTTNVNVANTTPVALAQTSGVGDFKIYATLNTAGTTVHVLMTVVGYYSRDMQTVHVHPVPGDDTGSGTRLINALAGITDASSTKHYVVKVEPGIYDVGSTMLEMKQYVDIEGSGQQATIIKGISNNDQVNLATAVVKGASDAELRDLQVQSLNATSLPISIAILINGTTTSVRDVTTFSTGTSTWGIRVLSASPTIAGVTIGSNATGSATGIGIKSSGSNPTIKRSVIKSTASSSAWGISATNGAAPQVRDVEVEANGSTGYGIYLDGLGTLDVSIVNSKVVSTTWGIKHANATPMTVIGSDVSGSSSAVDAVGASIATTRLEGGVLSATACAGVYDETFTFYASTCP